ncbi:MAG: leucyl aminopeptidase [Rickettsiaceae bacterium]|nr:leucyl aminopeptidase [Rickettsiaceae bacterium]
MINIEFTEKFHENAAHICVFIDEQGSKSDNTELLDKKYHGIISKVIKDKENFSGKFGQVKHLTLQNENFEICNIYLIGTGSDKEINIPKVQDLGGLAARLLLSTRSKTGIIESKLLGKISSEEVAANLGFGATLRSFNFDKYKTTIEPDQKNILEKIEIFSQSNKNQDKTPGELFLELESVARGIFKAREVISEPGNVLYPETYSNIIEESLRGLNVNVEILGETEMKALGMNALLGVGQGSTKESKLVIMTYNGAEDSSEAPVAFIGKGVTFDTGGISIKPAKGMEEMKYDMSGSAAVFGTIMALAGRGAKINAVGVVGLVENMPGGNAQRPGDVVKSMSGQTIEVINTDAEGRLVLADALWYTQERFKPAIMIDLATLTGAISIALGDAYAGLFSNNDELAKKLQDAGKDTGEELWRLPLHSSYDKMIESEIADLSNLGSPSGKASSSTAAQFLQKFVNKVSWAHLDIANVANSSKASHVCPKGAVGFGIKLLNHFVKKYYEK